MQPDNFNHGTIMSNNRKLGTSGLSVPLVGLGTNNFGGRLDLEASRRVIHKALDLGVTFFDTADAYGAKGGSESIIGEVLGPRRSEVILATKFGSPIDEAAGFTGASRRYVFLAAEASLKRLRTDWIDLYIIHRPDPATPIEETVSALHDLVLQGKVRYVGLSNFEPWQVVEAQRVARELGATSFIASQDEYSLLRREAEGERAQVLRRYGLSLLPYFPLASGLLTGKYRRNAPLPENGRLAKVKGLADRYLNDANFTLVEKLEAFANARDHSLTDLAFAWIASRDWVASIIAGASTPEQLQSNAKAAEWNLDQADLAEVARILSDAGK
jgi:aryl-alcohol dehydrogenase-like predicted oxidoreductase